ncbi:MAG: hypothetical protein ABL885_05005 [Methylophilaceae bacterium]
MEYCIFEYLYRDAGNFKVWGELLLEGNLSEADVALLSSKYDSGEFFIAEQIGIPTLYEALWQECESDPSEELDHVWHEFNVVRQATDEDLLKLKPWGTAKNFLASITKIQTWKPEMSRNWDL